MDNMPTTQSSQSFAEIEAIIVHYLAERDWLHNDPRSVAISIALEASELLEHYQWSDKPVGDTAELASELADIFIYAFQFAHHNNIDIAKAIADKLEVTKKKYPAEMFKDKGSEDRHEAWLNAKINHKKEGL